jgi:hypothetical protein
MEWLGLVAAQCPVASLFAGEFLCIGGIKIIAMSGQASNHVEHSVILDTNHWVKFSRMAPLGA